ncbi:MAG: 4-alpha-glucanotransferase [Nitrospirae bacterium RBG_16_64_22]|nr:MAG: 4-alpha-glucanotransferase [Nitrospirae bacterium RBG_16_64_22]
MNLEALGRLCEICGIAPDYFDIWGHRREISVETRLALLSAMMVPAGSDKEIEAALEERSSKPWTRVLPPVQVVREGEAPVRIAFSVPAVLASNTFKWTLTQEDGRLHEGEFRPAELEFMEGKRVRSLSCVRYAFALALALPPGYHRFSLDGPARGSMALIVAPETCHIPPILEEEGRVWGPAVQLYGVRSRRNWGIGDFSDLASLVDLTSRLGGSLVGVNPLHALLPHNPEHASPYSPSSRLFLNALYLDVEAIPDFAECPAAREAASALTFQARLRALRANEMLDYKSVARAKEQALETMYRHFRKNHLDPGTPRGQSFRAFQADRGTPLRRLALFEALQERFHGEDPGVWGWPAWPEAFRSPDSPDVAAFEAENIDRVEFREYLQWQADLQLHAAGETALSMGLGIGIYQDLAVSVDRGGAEAWASQDLYALQAGIGAPPDDFNLNGQDWGLPPPIPDRLREAAYAPFIATLRENMRHAGALRIDHVMGLSRLFWVPPGGTPADGAYVYYPMQDLLGILALESTRNRCLVIGEDLGTVPDEVRQALAPMRVLSYRLFYFERNPDASFTAPRDFTRQALVAVSTHDLPTLNGFWLGLDLDVRTRLGLFPSDEKRESQVAARARDRAHMLMALEREGLLPAGMGVHPVSVPEMTPELARAVHEYVARGPSMVMAVQADDVLGQAEQVNFPGTTDQYPNWRRKLPLDLEDWMEDERVRHLAAALGEQRGHAPRSQPAPAPAPSGPMPIPCTIPRASYRLQLGRRLTFQEARAIVPYLDELGVSHIYASPFLKARPGSRHGYDIIDHNAINPEIGSPEDLDRLVDSLRERKMGLILDLVPNHMGIMGADNAWWLDVLENGPASVHARFFDIDWLPATETLRGKVLVPVLGDSYGAALEGGLLKLVFDKETGAFSIFYHEHLFPIDPREYPRILARRIARLEPRLGADNPLFLEFQSLITAFDHLPNRLETEPRKIAERARDKEVHKRRLVQLVERSPDIAWFIEENAGDFNGTPGVPASFELLHGLLEAQAYRLADWRVAADEINYRRFFDINDLAGLRMEDETVFEETHRKVVALIAEGKVDGLRIDHPDGLSNPLLYFQRLQGRFAPLAPEGTDASRPLYVVVEKILAAHEYLPEHWPVHGPTGYGFANSANGLFVDQAAEAAMDGIYARFIGRKTDFEEILYRAKKLIMKVAMGSELGVLANQLSRIAEADRRTRDFTRTALRSAIMELVACFPVYRTYVADEPSQDDRRHVEWAVSVAKKRSLAADVTIFDFLRDVLLKTGAEGKPELFRRAVSAFVMKFQQYTGPVKAKGLEDTAFYIYNRLVSLNEVGGDPRRFGVSAAAFHHANFERGRRWPHALINTTTHDSKRSEDVRSRVNVLSEIPDEWRTHLRRWSRIGKPKKKAVDGEPAPSRNDEYLLYQTLVGAWPLADLDDAGLVDFRERIEAYMVKAAREAKTHTSWLNPNSGYEEAVQGFIGALIESPDTSAFLSDFIPFQKRVSRIGLYNSLSQTLLRLTSPGVPDTYQGCETWNFSLVDPDNRRAVDFDLLARTLEGLKAGVEAEGEAAAVRKLLARMEDGGIKFYVIWKTLGFRKARPDLFGDGDYVPLDATGERAAHVCAFARRLGNSQAIVIAPRLFASLTQAADPPVGPAVWNDTEIGLPEGSNGTYRNVFTGETVTPDGGRVPLSSALASFPLALLANED